MVIDLILMIDLSSYIDAKVVLMLQSKGDFSLYLTEKHKLLNEKAKQIKKSRK